MTLHLGRRLPAAVALIAIAVTGCGDSASDPEAEALLKQAFDTTSKIRSARFSLGLSAELRADDDPTFGSTARVDVNGTFERVRSDRELPRFWFAMNIQALTERFYMTATSTGKRGFVNVEDEDYAISGKAFRRIVREYAERGQTRRRLNPRAWIVRPRIVRADPILAKHAIKIDADLDVARMIDDLNAALAYARAMGISDGAELPERITDEQRRQILDDVEHAKVTVNVAKADKTIELIRVVADVPPPEGVEDTDFVTVQFDVGLADINEDKRIEAPADPKPPGELGRVLRKQGLDDLAGELAVGKRR